MNNNNLNIAKLIEGFKLSCQTENKSPKTVEWYISFLSRFRQFLEVHQMPCTATQIDRNHIRAFIRHLQTEAKVPGTNKSLSAATVQGYFRALKCFFSWLDREGYLIANPMTGTPIPKAPTKLVNTFTSEQIRKLTEVCLTSNGNGPRDLSILLLYGLPLI